MNHRLVLQRRNDNRTPIGMIAGPVQREVLVRASNGSVELTLFVLMSGMSFQLTPTEARSLASALDDVALEVVRSIPEGTES